MDGLAKACLSNRKRYYQMESDLLPPVRTFRNIPRKSKLVFNSQLKLIQRNLATYLAVPSRPNNLITGADKTGIRILSGQRCRSRGKRGLHSAEELL